MMRARTAVAAMVVLAVAAAGCGDDDDTASGNAAYCELARELDAQEDFASPEQLDALEDAAPEEIADEVDTAVRILRPAIETDDPESAFDDPELLETIDVIEEYEADECGIGHEGDDGGEDAAIDPEFADYCAIAIEVDAQEDFPSPEQLEELRATAPDEIADEAEIVVDAFLAAGDDPFAAFDQPGVEEAFGPIEAFDAEHCGIEQDDDDEPDQDPSVTQLDPAATRIDVTATDYAFALSAAPTAGRTSFVMRNEGAERHVMLLFRLAPGASTEDVLESEGDEGAEEEWESDTAGAGEEAVLTADLVPGEYGLICFIPTADGEPHFMLGMTEEFSIS